jgi:hypothetical protein
MKIVLILITVLLLSGFTSDEPQKSEAPPLGTALLNQLNVLNGNWAKFAKPGQECNATLNHDRNGNILDYKIIHCDNSAALEKTIKKSSPLPMPKDKELVEALLSKKIWLGR